MVHRTCSVFGLATVVALVGIGAAGTARCQDEDLARQFGDQLAALFNAPPQFAYHYGMAPMEGEEPLFPLPSDDWLNLGYIEGLAAEEIGRNDTTWNTSSNTSSLQDEDEQGAGSATPVSEPEASWLFEANGGRSLLGDGRETDAGLVLIQPFDADVLDAEGFSYDSRTIYEPPPTEALEPKNFQIGESFKMKAQPTGGLGGRVTLTFPFPVSD